MSDRHQIPAPTQWEIETYNRHKHLLLEHLNGENIWDVLTPFFDSRLRAKQVVYYMLYQEESYIRQILVDHGKESRYLVQRIAAAEAERPSQIRQEMEAAVYK